MHPDLIDRRDKSLSRKLREQSAAREMERHYNKEQILEAFLNQISFGHGWYGVESAARHYFGKGAAQLLARRSRDARGDSERAGDIRSREISRTVRRIGATRSSA